MTMPPNQFKARLMQGKRQPGLWLTLESDVAGSGYDWLLLDMEHTSLDVSQVADHIRAARGGTAELVVRIPWNEPIVMKRLLDSGVRSFMIPFVQSATEARAAVAARAIRRTAFAASAATCAPTLSPAIPTTPRGTTKSNVSSSKSNRP